jgi:ribosomal-protein-alanine N-acetyltransferase
VSARSEDAHYQVRRLVEEDLDRVMEIELGVYPHPWTRGIFSDCLKVGYECWGLQAGSVLAGYCIFTYAAGESHLLNLCIAPQWQRRGLGRLLLEHGVRTVIGYGCQSMFLEVRPSNPGAYDLYRQYGFRVVGERPGYYTAGEGREDAIVMCLDLTASR